MGFVENTEWLSSNPLPQEVFSTLVAYRYQVRGELSFVKSRSSAWAISKFIFDLLKCCLCSDFNSLKEKGNELVGKFGNEGGKLVLAT